MRFKKQAVDVALKVGGKVSVEALVIGHLAVIKESRIPGQEAIGPHYNITHIPSECRISGGLRLSDARRIAKNLIESGINLDFPSAESLDASQKKALRIAIHEAKWRFD